MDPILWVSLQSTHPHTHCCITVETRLASLLIVTSSRVDFDAKFEAVIPIAPLLAYSSLVNALYLFEARLRRPHQEPPSSFWYERLPFRSNERLVPSDFFNSYFIETWVCLNKLNTLFFLIQFGYILRIRICIEVFSFCKKSLRFVINLSGREINTQLLCYNL